MLNTNNKRKLQQISKNVHDVDDVDDIDEGEKEVKYNYFIPKRLRFETKPTEINDSSSSVVIPVVGNKSTSYTTNVITHVTIDSLPKEKKTDLEKKFESLTLSSAQVLLDCI